jgi:hypothetical protein
VLRKPVVGVIGASAADALTHSEEERVRQIAEEWENPWRVENASWSQAPQPAFLLWWQALFAPPPTRRVMLFDKRPEHPVAACLSALNPP